MFVHIDAIVVSCSAVAHHTPIKQINLCAVACVQQFLEIPIVCRSAINAAEQKKNYKLLTAVFTVPLGQQRRACVLAACCGVCAIRY